MTGFRRGQSFLGCAALCSLMLLLTCTGFAQANSQSTATPKISAQEFKKYSGVLAEFGRILQKTREAVPSPTPRNQSRLLPLLPDSTILYAALPNYGEASHQFLAVFHQELKTNAELRTWWQSGEMATEGPKIEDSLERFYQLSQYLGDEIVISASAANRGKEAPSVLVLAEVQKPGLKQFLDRAVGQLAGKSKPCARILDASELAVAKDIPGASEPVILVLPDLVVAAADLRTIRTFNAQLASRKQDFRATEFGQRLAQCYEAGTTTVAGIDLKTILAEIPQKSEQTQAMLQLTGFSDMKHLVWEQKDFSGQSASQFELSFTGSRRGVASWLAAPGPMHSLEFASPKSLIVGTLLLKNPATIFDDIRNISTASNPNAFAPVMRMEEVMKINLREDLFSRLGGELTFELDGITPPNPAWKVIWKADDPSGVLATLRAFFVAFRIEPVETDEDGVTYHTIRIPAGQKSQAIAYAMVNSYLIFGSSQEAVAEAVHLQRSGNSLAAFPKFQAALPTGSLAQSSAILYEDPVALAALNLQRLSPELAESLTKAGTQSEPIVMSAYGDETALREVSRSRGINLGATLVVAAIAIPNLLRARMAANEASAIASLRTANTAQITYASSYPNKGYARSLAVLGPDPKSANLYTAQHAGFIDSTLGNASCTAGAWCIKSGYRFTVTTRCQAQQLCREYLVVATPVSTSTGTRSFCSTSDAVIRSHSGTPLDAPITATECRSWTPLP
jgi:type IV pilus assembly protein PilA